MEPCASDESVENHGRTTPVPTMSLSAQAPVISESCSRESLRHKVEGRRAFVNHIKAPEISRGQVLKSNRTLKTTGEVPATLASEDSETDGPQSKSKEVLGSSLVGESLQNELIAWFHEAQWRHRRCKRTISGTPELFSEYIAATYNYEHFNIFLMKFSLQTRQAEYERLVDICYKIASKKSQRDGPMFDRLLAEHGISSTLYSMVKNMLAQEPPPFLDFEEAPSVNWEDRETAEEDVVAHIPVPAGSSRKSNSSWHILEEKLPKHVSDVVTPERVVELPKTTVLKLLEMMRGIVGRSDSQAAAFERRLQANEENFRRHLSAELERHDDAMRKIVSGRIIQLHMHSLKRVRLRREDSTLATEILELLEAAADHGKEGEGVTELPAEDLSSA